MKKFLKLIRRTVLAAALIFIAAFLVLPLPGQVPVLMYHFIGPEEVAVKNKNVVTRESFEKQMAFLKWAGYRVISLKEVEEIVSGKRRGRGREIAITFDDGHISFKEDAFPVLKKYEFPVTLFVVSDQVVRPDADRISREDLLSLSKYPWVDIQSHTKTHRVLSEAADAEIHEELVDSKKVLEEFLSRPIDYLAYPTGNIDSRAMAQAKDAGYKLAFITSYKKLKNLAEGPYTMPREKISRTSDNPLQFWVKLSGIYRSFKRLRHFALHPRS